jgi:hypothetical protein
LFQADYAEPSGAPGPSGLRLLKGNRMSVETEKMAPNVEKAEARKAATKVAEVAGCCAFATLVMGAFFGAPWPAAVASCGVSVMGMAIGCVLILRG